MQCQLEACQAENEEAKERVASLEDMVSIILYECNSHYNVVCNTHTFWLSCFSQYEDLSSQLTMALRVEETDTYDVNSLITEVPPHTSPARFISESNGLYMHNYVQVGCLSQECPELRLRVDTLTKTLKTCELDSRASRLLYSRINKE